MAIDGLLAEEKLAGNGLIGLARRNEVREVRAEGPRHGLAMVMWRGMSRLHRRFEPAALAALLGEAGFREPRAWSVLSGFGAMATAARP